MAYTVMAYIVTPRDRRHQAHAIFARAPVQPYVQPHATCACLPRHPTPHHTLPHAALRRAAPALSPALRRAHTTQRRGVLRRVASSNRTQVHVARKSMDGRTDRRVDGRTDGQTGGRTDGQTDRQTDGLMDGPMDGRRDELTDGWADELMDGRTGGRTGGRINAQKDERTDKRANGRDRRNERNTRSATRWVVAAPSIRRTSPDGTLCAPMRAGMHVCVHACVRGTVQVRPKAHKPRPIGRCYK